MNSHPSLEECMHAFSRIVDLLDGEYTTGDDSSIEQASDIATGFWRQLKARTKPRSIAVPALYSLDDNREAEHTYFFCSCKCQTQFSKRNGGVEFGCGEDRDYPADTICDECEGPLTCPA